MTFSSLQKKKKALLSFLICLHKGAKDPVVAARMDLSEGRSIVVGFKEIECDVQEEGATAKERVPVSVSRFAMERERYVDSVFDL